MILLETTASVKMRMMVTLTIITIEALFFHNDDLHYYRSTFIKFGI